MYKKLFILSFLIFSFVACERPVDLHVDNFKSQLVIVSNFTVGQPVQVQVSATRSPLSTDDSLYVKNATVILYQNNKLIQVLQRVVANGNDFYTTRQFSPSVGVVYTLKVQAPDFESVEATNSIPSPTFLRAAQVSNLSVQAGESPNRLQYQYNVSVNVEDPIGVENYYHLNFYQQLFTYKIEARDTFVTNEVFLKKIFNSITDENSYTAYFDGGILLEDTFFEEESSTLTFPIEIEVNTSQQVLGKLFVELRTVSKAYYLYHNSLSRQQTSSGGPFSEPVILFSNIQNGQGIFGGYSAVVDSASIRY